MPLDHLAPVAPPAAPVTSPSLAVLGVWGSALLLPLLGAVPATTGWAQGVAATDPASAPPVGQTAASPPTSAGAAAGTRDPGTFSLSGFGSLVLGRTAGACSAAQLGGTQAGPCTRFVADWAHGGLYQDHWSLQPETRAGLQADWRLAPQLSLTTQLTARTALRRPLQLEWAYATWRLSPDWQLQLGRKRLPLYHYSDFQDVGFAFDTVRPSPDVYGWDVVNYNGLSLAYTHRQGALNLRAELLLGQERSTDNAFLGLFDLRSRTLEWRDIRGLVLEASQDGWSGRLSHLQAQYRQTDASTGTVEVPLGGPPQRFSGLAINRDWGPWALRSEWGQTHRPALHYRARFHLATLGWRDGASTWTAGHNAYQETSLDTGLGTYGHHGWLLAWRRELHPGTAFKLQWDQLHDTSQPSPAVGNAQVFSASYDFIF
ncbi:hypothetical protein [Ideonella livida]|uniref:Porin n=1 Tax=Ideonella livida TaxID=2707176 RepID=A0A7C9TL38_9BURK|nr:hypothetical protein [Ideonella livida]NDY93121.1 hypothetical protein [Ideonella livida]